MARDRALLERVENREPDESIATSGARGEEQQIASGRPSTTPFAVLGIVAFAIWGVVALVAAIAFLVIWLV